MHEKEPLTINVKASAHSLLLDYFEYIKKYMSQCLSIFNCNPKINSRNLKMYLFRFTVALEYVKYRIT